MGRTYAHASCPITHRATPPPPARAYRADSTCKTTPLPPGLCLCLPSAVTVPLPHLPACLPLRLSPGPLPACTLYVPRRTWYVMLYRVADSCQHAAHTGIPLSRSPSPPYHIPTLKPTRPSPVVALPGNTAQGSCIPHVSVHWDVRWTWLGILTRPARQPGTDKVIHFFLIISITCLVPVHGCIYNSSPFKLNINYCRQLWLVHQGGRTGGQTLPGPLPAAHHAASKFSTLWD